ncbi:MAG: hypothetical protein EA415_07825 [Sphaerobacteraceae bacterium]|nr:MAG: hypothetical protein EA415_07825 [Sphaerobacteraceae bacterium]
MRRSGRFRQRAIVILMLVLLTTAAPVMAVIEAEEAFLNTWKRTDQPVQEELASRTWMWGPSPNTTVLSEAYLEHATGMRSVQYWDKSRMEINDPNTDSTDQWYVTNGLLARELMTGNMQFGDNEFQQYDPADVHVAGDPDGGAPSYAVFGELMDVRSFPPGMQLPSEPITQTVDSSGAIGNETSLATYDVRAAHYSPLTDHYIASVFWDFMHLTGPIAYHSPDGEMFTDGRLFEDPFYAAGLPLTEPYWVYATVDDFDQWVLVQAFERRILTYTPGNEPGWRVEAGNVGQHYYIWRYGEPPEYDPPEYQND